MLNDLLRQLRKYDMVHPGEQITCAVSGGADSMALLWGLYLLRQKLDIRLCAAHFNHHLRGAESDRDEQFVREFCSRFDIPLTVGQGQITPGKKGLEAAAREARYRFFSTLPGKIATAHTADDNAETVLMHLIRGTGLKGLGGIAPVNGNVIRPMLSCTRQQVTDFLAEYHIDHIEDSSNQTDAFLRNRLRHDVMPLLTRENPRLAENVSAMALRLRQDEAQLQKLAKFEELPSVDELQKMPAALRSRTLENFLKQSGVKEPEAEHIALCEALIFSDNPSAVAHFPGGITLRRNYGQLEISQDTPCLPQTVLDPNGSTALPEFNLTVTCCPAEEIINTTDTFTVCPQGALFLRSRESGDAIRLPGGTKSLKKLFIDRKIPAHQRSRIPVICDETGILAVGGIGVNLDRSAGALPAICIHLHFSKLL